MATGGWHGCGGGGGDSERLALVAPAGSCGRPTTVAAGGLDQCGTGSNGQSACRDKAGPVAVVESLDSKVMELRA